MFGNKFLAIVLVVLLVLLVGAPVALAQSDPPDDMQIVPAEDGVVVIPFEQSLDDTVFVVVILILTALFLVMSFFYGDRLAKAVPPEVATFMQGVTIVALQIAKERAASTPSTFDDKALANLAELLMGKDAQEVSAGAMPGSWVGREGE